MDFGRDMLIGFNDVGVATVRVSFLLWSKLENGAFEKSKRERKNI